MRVTIVCVILGGVLFAASAGMSWRMTKRLSGAQEFESHLYIPSGVMLRPLALGYREMFADMLWLKTISYFGGHAVTDHRYLHLANLLDAITTLDPTWDFPYHFAGIVLSMEADQVEASNRLLRRGIEEHPDVWQFPFYIGFNYFQVLNNPRCGAKYIFRASTHPKAPVYLQALAARLSARGNDLDNHIAMCNQLLRMTKDPGLTKQIKKHCDERLKKGNVEPETKAEDACP